LKEIVGSTILLNDDNDVLKVGNLRERGASACPDPYQSAGNESHMCPTSVSTRRKRRSSAQRDEFV
jgi:hypothetical protein